MSERLLSVGLDVGTTSTQLVVSRLLIENKAGSFAVPELEIEQREILYRSPVHFTPLLRDELVDASALRRIVDAEYAAAGITKEAVDTGAIIITGETSRKENAEAVLGELSDYAGDFVVATAGPDLESVLAAKGAGAAAFSAQTGKCVLHMDIGGGTSNLALIKDGKIMATTCLNVGGRLLKISPEGVLTYVSPVLKNLFHKHQGEVVSREEVYLLCEKLVQALEAAAGLREEDGLTATLRTAGSSALLPPAGAVISFSGGVADCIEGEKPWLSFGDMGPELGQVIKKSRLCRGEYRLGSETIRATVIGAGSHSTQLSGSTVFFQNMDFPLKNLPVVHRLEEQEEPAVLALKGMRNPDYAALLQLAEEILEQYRGGLLVLALEQDMAKALGQCLALRLGKTAKILCIDRVSLEAGSFLDVGAPVGPALPVVVKTLILNR